MDPIYGYQGVNVEAQERDGSSLLQWMKNLIGLRKLFPVLGLGTLRFLAPANRKVLAYLREHGNDAILCVANLSRHVQPVGLDLAPFAGLVPVEVLGYTDFPIIEERPYFLTLGPYGFYWFELQRRDV
jgi:maltose alpha-D-glucosyltransferase/alpha-amylase